MNRVSVSIAAVLCCTSFAYAEETVRLADVVVTPTGSEKESFDTALGANTALWVELAGLTASRQDDPGPNERETDGYTIGDVRVGVDLGTTWSFVAAVENLADESYQDHLSSVWQEFGMSDRYGRNVKLMAKARF